VIHGPRVHCAASSALSHPARDLDAPGAALALLVSLFWGGNTVALKLGLLDAPPLRLAWLRLLLGGAVIALWAWRTGRLTGFAIARDEWRPLAVLGVIFTAQIGLMNVGTALTSAAHGSVVLNLYAVHTVVLAHFLIPGDRLTARRLTGVLVAYGGIVILFAGETTTGASLLGDTLVFVSALLLAERQIYLARAVQRLDPVKLLLAQATVGTLAFVALSALLEPTATGWTPRLALSLAYQGALVAGFCFVINLWLLQRYRPSALAALFLTQPIFGVLVAALVAGDPLTLHLLAAGLAVALGIGLAR
jgi:drug/metabolite transporter (DMT)-like permease